MVENKIKYNTNKRSFYFNNERLDDATVTTNNQDQRASIITKDGRNLLAHRLEIRQAPGPFP